MHLLQLRMADDLSWMKTPCSQCVKIQITKNDFCCCCKFIIYNCDACKLVVIYRMDVNEFDAFDVFIESHSIDHTLNARGKFTVNTNDECECKNIGVIHVVIHAYAYLCANTHAIRRRTQHNWHMWVYMIQICITILDVKRQQWPLSYASEKKIRDIL